MDGVVDGKVEGIESGRVTSVSPSTPVQPHKVTVGSGDILCMLFRVAGGKKEGG